QGTVQHVFDLYAKVLNSPTKSPLQKMLNQFIVELGTHRLSPAELNTMFAWAREHNERYHRIMQFLSGEHKFPFFELECVSNRLACIKMPPQSHINVAPGDGFSFAFWFNLRSSSKESPEVPLCTLWRSDTSMNILDMRYHSQNGSILLKFGSEEDLSDCLICRDVNLASHRWYHIAVTFRVTASTATSPKYKTKPSLDIWVYINGIKAKHFYETTVFNDKERQKENENKFDKEQPDKRSDNRPNGASSSMFGNEMKTSFRILYGVMLEDCDCRLTIGMDKQHSNHHSADMTLPSSLVWWIGPFFVFAGVLSLKQVIMIVDAGSDYGGVFHDARAVSYIQEKEEKMSHCPNRIEMLPSIICSFHPHAYYSFIEARRVLQSSCTDLEVEELSPLLREGNSHEVSPLQDVIAVAELQTPGGIVKNTAHRVHACVTQQGPYAYLEGGVTSIRPIALEDAIRYAGGIENLLGFLSHLRSSKSLVDYLAMLETFLSNNPRNLMDMARIGGYEMVGNILKEKSEFITLDVIPVLIAMITNTIPPVMKDYFQRSENHTRKVRVCDPEIALYNHIGNPESSYKKRIYAMTQSIAAQRLMNTDEAEHPLNNPVPLLRHNSSAHVRNMDGPAVDMSPLSYISAKHNSNDGSNSNSESANNLGTDGAEHGGTNAAGDDVSLGLDYAEMRQKGLSLLELPIVIERRYLQREDERSLNSKESTWSGSERYIEEKALLANTLAMKYILFDYEIWSQVSTDIQFALYAWVKDLSLNGPAILNMEGMHKTHQFHRISGLPARALSVLSMRKWNAMRLRDLETMDDILYILAHRQVSNKIKMVIVEFNCWVLVDNAVDLKYEYRQHDEQMKQEMITSQFQTKDDLLAQAIMQQNKSIQNRLDDAQNGNSNSCNTTPTPTITWTGMENPIKHSDIVIEFMKMFYVYIHNNVIYAQNEFNNPFHGDHDHSYDPNDHNNNANVSNNNSNYQHSEHKANEMIKTEKSTLSLKFGNVLIDAEFGKHFAYMCEKLNVFWFAKFLSPTLGGQVNRASLCVLNKIMITVDNYMNNFSSMSGFQLLALLLPRLEPHPRVWIFMFSLLLGLEPFKCGAVNTRPQLPFTSLSLSELFPVIALNQFQVIYQTRALALLLSVIRDYVHCYIAGSHVDIGYVVVAVKFLWQCIKNSKRVRDEFVGDDSAHIELFVSILFDITYAKTTNRWTSRRQFNSSRLSLYLPAINMPELDNVLSSLLTKLLEERIQKHKVYVTFDRILRVKKTIYIYLYIRERHNNNKKKAFPTRRIKKDQSPESQRKLIQLYCVKIVCCCLHRLQTMKTKGCFFFFTYIHVYAFVQFIVYCSVAQTITQSQLQYQKNTELLLTSLMFVSNVRHLVGICSLTLQNYFSFNLLPAPKRRVVHGYKNDERETEQKNIPLSPSPSPSVSPPPSPAVTVAENLSFKRQRRHSYGDNFLNIRQLLDKQGKRKSLANTPVEQDKKRIPAVPEEEPQMRRNKCYLELIPNPVKIMRKFLGILQVCKSALDECMSINKTSTEERKEERVPSQPDLETLCNFCRKSVQSVLIFFMHKSLELSSKSQHLERLLSLVIQYQQVLFFTDSSEPDFFFLGLMHVLVKLLPDVANHGDKTTLSHNKERVAHHCLSVWDCVLMYQSHFLTQFLSKEPELNEKLRLIVTKRVLFLQWLRKGGLATAQTTFRVIFGKPWAERYTDEKNVLQGRSNKDKSCSKEQHQNLLSYEQQLKFIPMNIIHGNTTIQNLLSVEQARQISRKHQFYYRELFCHNKWLELVVLKLRLQSTLWLQLIATPWDEAWYMFVEKKNKLAKTHKVTNIETGKWPHRMRKILKRHTNFVQIFKANRRKFVELLSQLEPMQQFMNNYYSHDNADQFSKQQLLLWIAQANPSAGLTQDQNKSLQLPDQMNKTGKPHENDTEQNELKELGDVLEDSRDNAADVSDAEENEEEDDDEDNDSTNENEENRKDLGKICFTPRGSKKFNITIQIKCPPPDRSSIEKSPIESFAKRKSIHRQQSLAFLPLIDVHFFLLY
ncbi:WD repeat and FYVE domain containing 3, partial [Reticulomyxa filosa]